VCASPEVEESVCRNSNEEARVAEVSVVQKVPSVVWRDEQVPCDL
jgi:hypothetical protein